MERDCLFCFPLLIAVIFINLRKRNLGLLAQIQSEAPTAKKPAQPYPSLPSDLGGSSVIQELSQDIFFIPRLVPWFGWWPSLISTCISPQDSKGWQLELLKPAATAKVTLFLNCAPSSSGVNGISCRTGTEVPNEQKLSGEDGCSANEFVAAHITEATIIISSLAECLNKN